MDKEEKGLIYKILYYGTTVCLIIFDIVSIPIFEMRLQKIESINMSSTSDVIQMPYTAANGIFETWVLISIIGSILKIALRKKVNNKKIDLIIWLIGIMVGMFCVMATSIA